MLNFVRPGMVGRDIRDEAWGVVLILGGRGSTIGKFEYTILKEPVRILDGLNGEKSDVA